MNASDLQKKDWYFPVNSDREDWNRFRFMRDDLTFKVQRPHLGFYYGETYSKFNPVECPPLLAMDVVKLAVRLAGSNLAKVYAPHLAIPIKLLKGHYHTAGKTTHAMQQEVERLAGIYGPATDAAKRTFLLEGKTLQIGSVILSRNAEGRWTFSTRAFSIEIAVEFAGYILRDLWTEQNFEKYYVGWLVTRPLDNFSGLELNKDVPPLLPLKTRAVIDLPKTGKIEDPADLIAGLAAELEAVLPECGQSVPEFEALVSILGLARSEMESQHPTALKRPESPGSLPGWTFGLMTTLREELEALEKSGPLDPDTHTLLATLPIAEQIFADLKVIAHDIRSQIPSPAEIEPADKWEEAREAEAADEEDISPYPQIAMLDQSISSLRAEVRRLRKLRKMLLQDLEGSD